MPFCEVISPFLLASRWYAVGAPKIGVEMVRPPMVADASMSPYIVERPRQDTETPPRQGVDVTLSAVDVCIAVLILQSSFGHVCRRLCVYRGPIHILTSYHLLCRLSAVSWHADCHLRCREH